MKFLIILIIIILPSYINGCGFTTHNVIAHRAANYYFKERYSGYQDIVENNINSVLGGAPFPDYLYTCGSNHDDGEWAHWSPFQYNASNYIRSLPKPWTDDTKKLVAFMFGVVSHYIADINWHGLQNTPFSYGFINTLGFMDFNCSGNLCSVAHTAADTGGEFTAAYQTDLTWFEPTKWYVPTKHLVNIYALDNRKVEPLSIDECHLIFAAGAVAIKDISFLIYQQETTKAPFLQENYIHRPIGGVDDMAVWSARMWNRLAEWIENGPPTPVPPLLSDKDQRKRSSYIKKSIELIKTFGQLYLESPIYHRWLTSSGGEESKELRLQLQAYIKELPNLVKPTEAELKVLELLRERGINVFTKNELSTNKLKMNLKASTNSIAWKYQSSNPLEYVGYSLVNGDFNNDGYDDIVMGAPGKSEPGFMQHGAIYIIDGKTNKTSEITGNDIFGRFGSSMVVLDFNLDGIDDLVVASPINGWNWTETQVTAHYHYRGSVYIFYGSNTYGLSSVANYTITSNDELTFLGTILRVGDINNDGKLDLLMGQPYAKGGGAQRGMILGFESNTDRKTSTSISYKDAELVLNGKHDFEWFGHDLLAVNDKYQGAILLVGAPGYRSNNGKTTVGRLYGISLNDTSKVLFTIKGKLQQGKLGYSLAYGYPIDQSNPLLALSIPSANNTIKLFEDGALAGQVAILSLKDLSGDIHINDINLHALLKSGSYGARFGWSLQFTKNNDLLVGAPMLTAPWDRYGHQSGAVLGWKHGSSFVSGTIEPAEQHCDVLFTGSSTHGRFGHSFLVSGSSLYVSEPQNTANSNVEMSGSVYRYDNVF